MTTLKCSCGRGVMKPATLDEFDFEVYAGIPSVVRHVPGFRCTACGEATLDGKVANRILDQLVADMIVLPHRLDARSAVFLRKWMALSQKELGERMGIARETVARWETGADQISAVLDYLLRGLATNYLIGRGIASAARGLAGRLKRLLGSQEGPLSSVRHDPPPKGAKHKTQLVIDFAAT